MASSPHVRLRRLCTKPGLSRCPLWLAGTLRGEPRWEFPPSGAHRKPALPPLPLNSSLKHVVHLVKWQDLMGLEDDVLAVVDAEASLVRPSKATDVVGIVSLGHPPDLGAGFKCVARVLAPTHVVHRAAPEQVALNQVRVPEADTATEHRIYPLAGDANRCGHVLLVILLLVLLIQAAHLPCAPR